MSAISRNVQDLTSTSTMLAVVDLPAGMISGMQTGKIAGARGETITLGEIEVGPASRICDFSCRSCTSILDPVAQASAPVLTHPVIWEMQIRTWRDELL